ncbi:MAG: hypothetical protein GY696_23940, partial [Gammaproteobacteria bacterium]|nr:hypothetical protein [Gammaproteobacteria bacterium]
MDGLVTHTKPLYTSLGYERMDCIAICPPATSHSKVHVIQNGLSFYACGQPGHRQRDCLMGSNPRQEGGAAPSGPSPGQAAYPPRAQSVCPSLGRGRVVVCFCCG